jgi:hypothetical protein
MRRVTERMPLPSAEWKSSNSELQCPMLPGMVDCDSDGPHAEETLRRSHDIVTSAGGSWKLPMAVGEIQRNEIDLKHLTLSKGLKVFTK